VSPDYSVFGNYILWYTSALQSGSAGPDRYAGTGANSGTRAELTIPIAGCNLLNGPGHVQPLPPAPSLDCLENSKAET